MPIKAPIALRAAPISIHNNPNQKLGTMSYPIDQFANKINTIKIIADTFFMYIKIKSFFYIIQNFNVNKFNLTFKIWKIVVYDKCISIFNLILFR